MIADLISIAARSLVIAFAGLVLLWFARRSAASVRHVIGVTTLLGVLALPLLQLIVPKQYVPVHPVQVLVLAEEAKKLAPTVDRVVASAPLRGFDWAALAARSLPLLWAVGSALLFARLALGLAFASRCLRRSYASDFDPQVRISPDIDGPMTLWAGRHLILLPDRYEEWPETQRQSVILHELAHVRRGDWFAMILGRIACVAFWINPLVWVVQRQASHAAEEAADNLVLNAGVTPSAYAKDLMDVAGSTRSLWLLPMGQKAHLADRVKTVLDDQRPRGTTRRGFAAGTLLAGTLMAVIVSGVSFGMRMPSAGPSGLADISDGLTVAGWQGNGFVGQLADGRRVELLHVERRTEKGSEVFRPDGTPLKTAPRSTGLRPGDVALTFRVPTKAQPKKVAAALVPVGGYDPDLERTSSRVLPPKQGYSTVRSVAHLVNGEQTQKSFEFRMADGEWKPTEIKPARALPLAYKTFASRTKQKDGSTSYVEYSVPLEKAGEGMQFMGITQDGKSVEPMEQRAWNSGTELHTATILRGAPSGYRGVRISTRHTYGVDFLGVAVRPKP